MISVIVPVYNAVFYVEKCIRSIMRNTYTDLEIICVNDGSTDMSAEILKSLAEEDTRIIIKDHHDNLGVSDARNAGILLSSGDYISFIDSDDWIHPQYFETLLRCMEHTRADVVACGFQKFSMDNDIFVETVKHIHFERISAEGYFNDYHLRGPVWGKLYRRKILIGKSFVSHIGFAEDTLYNLTVLSFMDNPLVYKTTMPLYYYFQRKDSIVHSTNPESVILISEWVAEHPVKIGNSSWSWMILLQAIKFTLSYRYGTMLRRDKSAAANANKLLRVLSLKMLREKRIGRREKIIHITMALFPSIYRFFRIKDDPTMKEWESKTKKQHFCNS